MSTMRTWTIWEVVPDEDGGFYHLRVNSLGGPAGNTETIKIGRKRLLLLLNYFDVREVSDLYTKTFESTELKAAAALYDFLLKILQFD
ncbi:MAG: hypothetical protein UV71_C0003G0004 [Microgenomates group bacterium GW2011_GWC1_43_13]|uniref:Uncharacterized protein n=3 Tax=Candidatus Woeseibacteriota TaxID=1752722 RepID=A0A837IC91_9BACT|nr:MAG: hypothetical protein UV71_C0003G0004 [Microgenomates group bacterium GW2011_GWC1_43_13]KKT32702.1 MAG: hypothetical protein UW20_C0010G0004 [Candidatus Woesebacteria bacterium GW2011_GWB1_44_11]KKT53762.1 MAG: hypothetical protein UW47_C0018G0004 [Candidatus Woesebacteria bacterium GW2011_GWA1_44_23]OGM76155.1 MAG: hypothetical protein A2208_00165 [Candidatus Woesebacteria bacterium RIFOXYA1_FULL_43_16]OGM81806.1 MAG: hypothetical protein A2394_02565 [Candidatus Woesebacteria bacterium 